MTTFTDDDVRGRLADVLAAARQDGEVRIRTGSGEEYVVRPAASRLSLGDLPSLNLGLTAEEIVAFVREGREREIYPPRGESNPDR
ncbi:MAG: hypothetical protein AVDCRST_MAG64-4528 [uncultured Phycisphaerae bacterium]|uniref:Antitoxin n=1 Tax=uncultured Phycisphaerae bacterium TaxID=904963 RepID=A0A6J4QPK0_9BACT|nr:MAG: hypothetical protein AVDCRST_MAG64-4528 [uncultured Phycisphaerae bacterium]